MRSPATICFLLGTVASLAALPRPAAAAADRGSGAPVVTAGMPSDFADLSQSRNLVADIYFGGRRIGQFEIEADPARVHILHPDQVAAAIPDVADPAAMIRALSGDLDPHARLVCLDAAAACERPTPEAAAIVFDQQHFRIDLYLNPKLLLARPVSDDRFLEPDGRNVSLVDTIGAAIAGGSGQQAVYNFRNRAVLAAGNGRLISEMSVSSGRGLDVDTLAGQLDRPDLRYVGGLFYTPGADLVGRRRILGVGIGSQFDTRADRLQLTGSPLIVFLGQRSRVDLYSEGKLMSSHSFEAGNQTLDTSNLPDGSYPIDIRIQEASGATRTEHRFFTKSAAIAPIGRIIFFANAGMLALDRQDRWVSVAHTPLLSAGIAGRLGTHFAWDGVVMATDHKALTEVGLTYLSPIVQTRVALLGSSSGDVGEGVQIGSTTGGALSYNLDFRHVHSGDGAALIPFDDYVDSLSSPFDIAAARVQASSPSFTQIVGNLSYHLAGAQVGMTGYYRHDQGRAASYAVGPVVRWPILHHDRLQMTFDGSYAETNQGHSIAFGLQLQIFGGRSTLTARAGAQTGIGSDNRAVGDIEEVAATIQRDNVLGGELAGAAVVQHSADGTVLQASADQRGPMGYASASLVQRFAGSGNATQYAMTLQTSIAAGLGGGHDVLRVGTHDQNDSVITVGIHGSARDTRFQVMVDDAARGQIRPGEHLTLAVTPYRRYRVRILPVGGDLVAFDAQTRSVDVYPGTVAGLEWKANTVLAMFGHLVRADGSPVADADITTDGAVAATDHRGYFQLQASGDAEITARGADGQACRAKLGAARSTNGYTALGDVKCIS